MANIAGGFNALGGLEGARDFRSAEGQNIQNQGAQMDLDARRDAERAYVAVMEARLRASQKKQGGAADAAQIPPAPNSALSAQPPQGDVTPIENGAVDASGSTIPAPQAQPAPAQASALSSKQPPATAPVSVDPEMASIAKSLGVDVEALKGIGRTPGAMQGLMAAKDHVEKMEKQQVQSGINQMYRSLATKPEAVQRQGVAEYLQEMGLGGSPASFVEVRDKEGNVTGWNAVHGDERPADFIPNQGGGFLDTMTRMLYGAVDRYGTISAGIEAETKLAPEKIKARTALETQKMKNEGFLNKANVDNAADKDIAHIQGGYRVKAAGVSASAGNKAETSAEKARAKRIDQRIKALEQQRKGLEKDITGKYSDPAAARRIDQELEGLYTEISDGGEPQEPKRSRPRATKHFSQYE